MIAFAKDKFQDIDLAGYAFISPVLAPWRSPLSSLAPAPRPLAPHPRRRATACPSFASRHTPCLRRAAVMRSTQVGSQPRFASP
jgi:hypothetical protein